MFLGQPAWICVSETQIQRNLFFMKEFSEKLRKQAAINLDIRQRLNRMEESEVTPLPGGLTLPIHLLSFVALLLLVLVSCCLLPRWIWNDE